MELLIYTCLWGRPEITKLFMAGVDRLVSAAPAGIKITKFATVSEDWAANTCVDNGWEYLKHDNFPLGKKWNAGLNDAINRFNFGHVLILGSDDIVSSEMWQVYETAIKQKLPFFGVSSMYAYSPKHELACKFEYQIPYKPIGAGCFIAKSVMQSAGYMREVELKKDIRIDTKPYFKGERYYFPANKAAVMSALGQVDLVGRREMRLWGNQLNKGLDGHRDSMILHHTGTVPFIIKTEKPIITDVKSPQNVWSYQAISHTESAEPVEIADAISFFGDRELAILEEIKAGYVQ